MLKLQSIVHDINFSPDSDPTIDIKGLFLKFLFLELLKFLNVLKFLKFGLTEFYLNCKVMSKSLLVLLVN